MQHVTGTTTARPNARLNARRSLAPAAALSLVVRRMEACA